MLEGSRDTGATGEIRYGSQHVLPRSATEYFHQNVWMGVSTPGAADLAVRHEIGIDRFMWGSDYPHDEGSHPYTREHLRSRLSGIAPAEVRKILSERSEEHTSELQSLMRISYDVYCLKKKKHKDP